MRRGKGPGDQEDPGTREWRDQGTKGPEDQGSRGPRDQETKGPGDQRTRGPGDQRIRETWICFSNKFIFVVQSLRFFVPGNLVFFSSIIPLITPLLLVYTLTVLLVARSTCKRAFLLMEICCFSAHFSPPTSRVVTGWGGLITSLGSNVHVNLYTGSYASDVFFLYLYIYTYVCVHLNVYFHMNWWLLQHSQRPCPVAMIKKTDQHVSWRAFTRRPGIVGYPPAIKHGLQENFPIYRRFSHKRTSRIGDFHCHVWLPKGTFSISIAIA